MYYDQSISMVEALSFDKANIEDGYYLDEHDNMQVSFMWASQSEAPTRVSNVFQAEVCEQLNEVSCQTTFPETHVTYEVYLLSDDFRNPEDGILVAHMEDDYQYGGFHKKAVELVESFPSDRILIQQGQYYSIVVTQQVADGTYAFNTPLGYGEDPDYMTYQVGIINKNESFVLINGEWYDYSDESVRDSVFANPGIDNPAFDNFPIKGFCTAMNEENKDLEIRLIGDSDLAIYGRIVYTYKLRFASGSDAELPEDAQISWALADGGEELVDMTVDTSNGSSTAELIPKKEGETYLILTVDGVGTTVKRLNIFRIHATYFAFVDCKDDGSPIDRVYTGEPIEPEVIIYLDAPLYWQMEKDKDYAVEYSDNIRCGVGNLEIVPIGKLDGTPGFTLPFPIYPAKATITNLTESVGQITVSVADQKDTGITGYTVMYRPLGESEWESAQFSAESTELTLTGLTSGTQYEVQACGYVDVSDEYDFRYIENSYSGEPSEIMTSSALPEKQSFASRFAAFLQKLEAIPVLRLLTPALRAIMLFFERTFPVHK
ncbi:MAG: fibronectin type III domain-containing protein [Clostridiales bacterium]|nr:fibronectin type III domain-containing protein [Clostridiales bacterium]